MKKFHGDALIKPVLILNFLLSWIIWGILAVLVHAEIVIPGTKLFIIMFIAGGLGATISPLIILAFFVRRDEAKELFFHRLFRIRTHWGYYAAALLLTAGYYAVDFLLSAGFSPYRLGHGYSYGAPFSYVLVLLPSMILAGGLEEISWRGIGVQELFRKMNPASAAVIIGVIWMMWHIPLFIIPGTSQYGTDFILFACKGFGFSLILAPLMYFSKSAVPCIAAHALFNSLLGINRLYPVEKVTHEYLIGLMLVVFGALVFSIWSILEKKKGEKELEIKGQKKIIE